MILLVCGSCAAGGGTQPRSEKTSGELIQQAANRSMKDHLTPDHTVKDLLNHPAFAAFGRLLLPWDDRSYAPGMRLREVGALMPYHSQVHAPTVVNALNHLIDDVNEGRSIFYDFYTDLEKQEQPTKANVGLFFFRGKPGAPFAVIAAGGGFAYVGSLHEGFPYAAAIAKHGYNAFVLKYRAGAGGQVATRDLAAAISYVFRNAGMLGVDTQNYSLWGSSAGARMAAAIGSHGVARFGGDDLPAPSAVVTLYTGHSEYTANEPPTFVAVGDRDGVAPPHVMSKRAEALRSAGTEVEFHRYRDVGHGFGLGIGTSAEGWIDSAVRFWQKAMNTHAVRSLEEVSRFPA
jgi:acetyl esterase/lipase